LIKHIRDKTNPRDGLQNTVVYGDYAGTLLSTVLKSVKSEVAEARGFWVAIDSDDPTLFAGFIGEIGGAVLCAVVF